jgi:phospholipid-binding lipoprotein MlaA
MKRFQALFLFAAFVLVTGCGTAQVRTEPVIPAKRPVSEYVKPDVTYTVDAYDPWEGMNRKIYNFNAIFDEYVFLPVVRGYEFVMPELAQTGVSNFFRNLTEVTNLMNTLLQLKGEKFMRTLGRIIVNSTVGLGGLIDVATLNGAERVNEDFGQTLGFYGVGPGPYLMLPLLGPSTVRDASGLAVDWVVYSLMMSELIGLLNMDDPEEYILSYGISALYVVDKRHNESFRYFMTGSPFEYDLIRRLYLLQREFQIMN